MRRGNVTRITAPAATPVSLAEVKAALAVEHDEHDAMLERQIRAATTYLDGWHGALGLALVTQTWDERFACFPGSLYLGLSLAPAQQIDHIKYFDPAGIEQTWSATEYELVPDGADRAYVHAFDGWPSTDTRRALPITVRTTIGFGDPEEVPDNLRDAIIRHVGTLYQHDDAVGGALSVMPLGYDDLIRPWRRPWLAI